jgi:hypothetical protein
MLQAAYQLGILLFLLFSVEVVFEGVDRGWIENKKVYDYCTPQYKAYLLNNNSFLADVCNPASSSYTTVLGESAEYDAKINLERFTIIFNSFVFMQLFNEFNARKVNGEMNVYEKLHTNPMFLIIMIASAGMQILMVEFFGPFAKTVSLDWKEWLFCVGLGSGHLFWGFIVRIVKVDNTWGMLEVKPETFEGAHLDQPIAPDAIKFAFADGSAPATTTRTAHSPTNKIHVAPSPPRQLSPKASPKAANSGSNSIHPIGTEPQMGNGSALHIAPTTTANSTSNQ